jgi:hypothetical protein
MISHLILSKHFHSFLVRDKFVDGFDVVVACSAIDVGHDETTRLVAMVVTRATVAAISVSAARVCKARDFSRLIAANDDGQRGQECFDVHVVRCELK